MNCAKVIGKTYSKFMHPSVRGIDIKILQIVDAESGELSGKPFFAADPLGVAIGEFVAYEESFQATWAFKDHMVPFDRSVTAIIDSLDIDEAEKSVRIAKSVDQENMSKAALEGQAEEDKTEKEGSQ